MCGLGSWRLVPGWSRAMWAVRRALFWGPEGLWDQLGTPNGMLAPLLNWAQLLPSPQGSHTPPSGDKSQIPSYGSTGPFLVTGSIPRVPAVVGPGSGHPLAQPRHLFPGPVRGTWALFCFCFVFSPQLSWFLLSQQVQQQSLREIPSSRNTGSKSKACTNDLTGRAAPGCPDGEAWLPLAVPQLSPTEAGGVPGERGHVDRRTGTTVAVGSGGVWPHLLLSLLGSRQGT